MSTNCNTSSLAVYANPSSWGTAEIYHLYRRAAFGISPASVLRVKNLTPEQTVDNLINDAANLPVTPAPEWANNHTDSDIGDRELQKEWRHTMFKTLKTDALRGRLMLFWSNHFVTQFINYQCPSYWYDYIAILQRNCLGNLKTFIYEIGICPAMLVYLNGNKNKQDKPNENYARELYELFALGEGLGYTQKDIEDTAKALTGYTSRVDRCSPYTFNTKQFNTDEKTIFGKTGNWGYDDVINLLFDERPNEIAQFMVKKLYKYFIHPELPNASIIDELATDLKENGFELEPLMRKLLKSQHFFDRSAHAVVIKSPIDQLITFYNDFMMPFPERDEDYVADNLFYWGRNMGQEFFEPPNVAGWQMDKTWISPPRLLARWQYVEEMIKRLYNENDKDLFSKLLIALVNDPAEEDVEKICKLIVEAFLPEKLLSALDYENALETFKSNVPANYFEDGTWGQLYPSVPEQMRDLLIHIIKQPEFQLK